MCQLTLIFYLLQSKFQGLLATNKWKKCPTFTYIKQLVCSSFLPKQQVSILQMNNAVDVTDGMKPLFVIFNEIHRFLAR